MKGKTSRHMFPFFFLGSLSTVYAIHRVHIPLVHPPPSTYAYQTILSSLQKGGGGRKLGVVVGWEGKERNAKGAKKQALTYPSIYPWKVYLSIHLSCVHRHLQSNPPPASLALATSSRDGVRRRGREERGLVPNLPIYMDT